MPMKAGAFSDVVCKVLCINSYKTVMMNQEKDYQFSMIYDEFEESTDDYWTKENSRALMSKQLPLISSSFMLSLFIGIDSNDLQNMALNSHQFYRQFYIPKANGKQRLITEPLPELKQVQYWILHNILEKCPISKYAKAFIKDKSLISNAKYHLNQNVVVTLDIMDFFPSISFYMVRNLFHQLGYALSVSTLLASLCCYRNALPQGAPTSPYLSNLCMIPIDAAISKYILFRGIRYTRYADDLTFSGTFDPHKLIHNISSLLYKFGFHINPDKTRVAHQNARQEVTGIVVNSHMQMERSKRKAIRQQMYYIKKYGIESHLSHIKESKAHYLNHLLGQINFALFVNPKDKEMRKYFELVKRLKKQEI